MHMIRYTADTYVGATRRIDQLADIGVNTIQVCLSEAGTCRFDMEYQMYVQFAE